MENVASYVTWDQLIQLGIFTVALLNLICFLFHNHNNKKK